MDWGRKWLVNFNAGKTEVVSFEKTTMTGITDKKWMGLFFRKNYILSFWGCLSLLNWIVPLKLSLLLKLPPRKL